MKAVQWYNKPQVHDFPAAHSYLNLIYDDAACDEIIKKFSSSPLKQFKAKDIFRAASLPLLSKDNFHVSQDRERIKNGEKLSPILLYRDPAHGKVVIADGYHRLCAVYSFYEDANIPCVITS